MLTGLEENVKVQRIFFPKNLFAQMKVYCSQPGVKTKIMYITITTPRHNTKKKTRKKSFTARLEKHNTKNYSNVT